MWEGRMTLQRDVGRLNHWRLQETRGDLVRRNIKPYPREGNEQHREKLGKGHNQAGPPITLK